MKIYFLSISLLSVASAFTNTNSGVLTSPGGRSIYSNIVLSAEESSSGTASKRKIPLSPKELLAAQREKSGLPDPDEYPKLYSDELLEDMRDVLRLLERRVQGGLGSLSSAEAEDFATKSNSIIVEMKQKENERLADASSPSSESPPAATVLAATASASAVVEKPEAETSDPEEEMYDPEVEGPGYDPSGGQGSISKGTRNTYIIPGMESMSSDEYRLALQQSLIDRQSQRKATGTYGNRNTWDYLNNLSGNKHKGALRNDDDDELEN